jgi:hypothetical protein
MKWLSFILRAVLEALGIWRSQKKDQQAATADRRRREEQAARDAEQKIRDAANEAERPNLDSSEDTDDPMGVEHWNRKRR